MLLCIRVWYLYCPEVERIYLIYSKNEKQDLSGCFALGFYLVSDRRAVFRFNFSLCNTEVMEVSDFEKSEVKNDFLVHY